MSNTIELDGITYNRELGKVESVFFGREDRGILTIVVNVAYADFNGVGQGFGCIYLDTYDKALNRRVGTARGCDFILQLLSLFDVNTIDEIKSKYVYTLRRGGWNSVLDGLQRPEVDGGKSLVIETWRREWEKRGDR